MLPVRGCTSLQTCAKGIVARPAGQKQLRNNADPLVLARGTPANQGIQVSFTNLSQSHSAEEGVLRPGKRENHVQQNLCRLLTRIPSRTDEPATVMHVACWLITASVCTSCATTVEALPASETPFLCQPAHPRCPWTPYLSTIAHRGWIYTE